MKKIIICSSIIIVIFIIYAFIKYREPNNAEGANLDYYNKIESSIKNNKIVFEEVFTFEWDKLYIQESPRMDEKELSDVLGFDCNLAPLEDWFGYPYRVLFIKDQKIVYDFQYDIAYLDFEVKNIIVKKEDANFYIVRKRPITLTVQREPQT